MTFEYFRFPAVSPTSGNGSEGIILGKINSSSLNSAFGAIEVTPILAVMREDVTASGRTLTDVTTAATDSVAGDFQPFGTQAQMSEGDAFYFRISSDKVCNTLHFSISTPGAGVWTLGVQEWNASSETWVDMPIASSDADNLRAAVGVHSMSYTHLKNGALRLSSTDASKYIWHRVYVKTFTSCTTAPVLSRVWAESSDLTYIDVTTAFNTGDFTGYIGDYLPTVGAHTVLAHPGPAIGMDITITVGSDGVYTLANEYLASDGTWKAFQNFVDPSNHSAVLGNHKLRWTVPADWVSSSLTLGASGFTATGWLMRRRIDAISTQGPRALVRYTAKSRALGAANSQGLEAASPQSYSVALVDIGANTATADTVLQLVNANTGVVSTVTVPQGVDSTTDVAGGKINLSSSFAMASGDSMIVMCKSGGPLTDVEVRLQ